MKRSPIRPGPALAAALMACAAHGHAQTAAAAVIYGRINTGIEHVDASRSPVDLSRYRLSNYRSTIGFRGEEDLGAGLKAVWQIEGGFSSDTGAGSMTNRDTRVGLQGGFGTLFLGVWTLPYTSATAGFDPFYPTTAGYMAVMGNGSASTTDHLIDTSSFDRRQQNLVQYWSPKWHGVSARLAYGFNDGQVNAAGAKPSLWSGSVTYDAQGLLLTLALERHKAYQAPGTADTAAKIGAAHQFGALRLAAVFERIEYETATGDLERDSWYVSANWKLGAGSLRAGYARAGDGSGGALETIGFMRSGAGTGAWHTTIGYEHELSKRTALFAYYSRIGNESQALYDFAINGLDAAPGARPSVVAIGMRHAF
jgi:predicted porin